VPGISATPVKPVQTLPVTVKPVSSPAAPAPARPQPSPIVAKAVAPAAPVAKPAAADPFIGKIIGSYRVEKKLGDGKWGAAYEAIQTSMNRPVSMQILSPELAKNPETRQQFIANASAKANVDHPHILSVYEAGEADGVVFYTHEHVDGSTLADLATEGLFIDEPTSLQTVKIVAEGLSFLNQRKLAHAALEPGKVFIGADNSRPRLANLATASGGHPTAQKEMQTLAAAVLAVLPNGRARDHGLQSMLMRMRKGGPSGFLSWPALLQTVKTLEPKVIPADAFKLSAQDEAAIRAVAEARKRQQRQLIWTIAGLFVVLWIVGLAVWWKFFRSTQKDFDVQMVEIPAGEFIYQDGQTASTSQPFWIDKYEVTMEQYEKFLEYLKKSPTTVFDHPRQPKGKSHIPKDWEIYWGRASSGFAGYRTVKGAPISVDCPVFMVDYWDAYAYAKWKGHRLPTEQEWEKAARGTDGRLYPWGNNFDPKKCNSGADYSENAAGAKANADGYVWWSPVDAIQADKSPYGVIGMAGNVSEWTDSWDAAGQHVIVRGGSYHTQDVKVTKRVTEVLPDSAFEYLGFRTASDTPPKK